MTRPYGYVIQRVKDGAYVSEVDRSIPFQDLPAEDIVWWQEDLQRAHVFQRLDVAERLHLVGEQTRIIPVTLAPIGGKE